MPADFFCPACRLPLTQVRMEKGIFWACGKCGGRVLTIDLLRRTFRSESIAPLWRHVLATTGRNGRACPSCGRATCEVALTDELGSPAVDVCRLCQFVWFDPNEMAGLQPKPSPPTTEPLPAKARETLALFEVDRLAREIEGNDFDSAAPNEWWKQIAAFCGVPVEFDAPEEMRRPWATWLLCLTILAVSLAAPPHLRRVVDDFGLIPAQAGRLHGLTFVTAFFLHAGVFHLVGNLYFLFVFGDNVENFLGWWRYLLLVALAAFAGDCLHLAFDPHSNIPSVGASGGIAGVIVFYALAFPRIRLGFLLHYWYYFRWVRLPAWSALVIWILFQSIGAYKQVKGLSSISSLAHLGGAAVGLLAWLAWRKSNFVVAAAE